MRTRQHLILLASMFFCFMHPGGDTHAAEQSAAAKGGKDKALYDSDDTAIIKRSRANLCHDQTSGSFAATLHYKAYRTMKDCLESGGRRAE